MRRRTGWLVAAGAAAAGVVTAGAFAFGGGPRDGVRDEGGAPPSTAEVVRTDLVLSKTVDGTVDFAGRRPVKPAVEGTVTVAAREGATVRQGQALYELDDKPVTLLYGPVPMFRAMKEGDRGTDVLQLERNLRDLGYGAGLYIDVRYDAATAAAVKRWQKSLNRVPTGRVGKGEVVFQGGPVKVVAADAALGDQVGPDGAVLTAASPTPVVRAEVDQGDSSLAARGTKAEIRLADGKKVRGRVTGTVRPETTEDSGPPGDGITVEIALGGGAAAPSGEAARSTASVTFVSESRRGVLAVPVEALVALRGESGGYGLQLVPASGPPRMVRVETGMTADGRIEVRGAGLREGVRVGVATQ
ncbi:efflux RND transporter periplasmic adaptor subunit [Streptomyces sp. AN091965]|uniref:efflux RND transporter periplasmic adaptor subunit n=1 Tax=Streptomyces sp. AN091965 TaxID=2927803 RepID=UPI001F6192DD|nr:peptidoglycan-binding protein [Streptomyces sp. AN091965]MCI3931945.1 peptidoglycan-binding protein [Streptomyces sp. AN091965]